MKFSSHEAKISLKAYMYSQIRVDKHISNIITPIFIQIPAKRILG